MNILDGQIDFHGLTLRPLTIGSMELCRAFGLGLFTGEQVSPPEQIRQTAAYLWIQSEPLPDVIASAQAGLTPEAWHSKYILPFMFRITPKALGDAAALIMKSLEDIGQAVVDVEAKPDQRPEDVPPNS